MHKGWTTLGAVEDHMCTQEEGLRLRAGWADTEKNEVTTSTERRTSPKSSQGCMAPPRACFKVSKEWNDR